MKKRIYILAILLTAILLPGISRAADLDANKCKKFFGIWGYYTPEREAALKKLGLDDRQIDQFYVDMLYYFDQALLYDGSTQDMLDLTNILTEPQFFYAFRREGCWAVTGETEAEMRRLLYTFRDLPMDDLFLATGVIENSILNTVILDIEKEKGVEAMFSNNIPEASYCDKVAKLLRLMHEDEIFKTKMKSHLKSIGASIFDDKVDFYVDKGNYTYRMACVFQDYLTEKQLDDLIYLYSTQEGFNLTRHNVKRMSTILNMYADANNNYLTVAETGRYDWYKTDDKLLRDGWLLGKHQSMRDFQAVWDIIDCLSETLMRNDLEEDIIGLDPGSLSNRSESKLDRRINDYRDMQKRLFEQK